LTLVKASGHHLGQKRMIFRIPRVVRNFAAFFERAGYQCYLVGGAVRDMFRGEQLQDFDIATDALPQEVSKIFRRVIPTGIKHGTVTVLFEGTRFEVTTFRIDQEYLDGRRPESVVFTPSIEEDLKRRDFTINAIAYDLHGKNLLDPHHGQRDLKAAVIRAIGDPVARFREDGLRPVRACRFAAQFRFEIEKHTFTGIARCLETVGKVSAERIRDELIRLLGVEKPSLGFKLMKSSGLLDLLIPELARCRETEQGDLHRFDLFEHLIYACDAAPRENLEVRLAALLHDVGKPESLRRDAQGSLSFHRHEQRSSEIASRILRRLRFSNLIRKRVCHLIREHMFHYEENWTDAAVRRFVARIGEENLADILALRRADQLAITGEYFISESLVALEKRIEQVLGRDKALSLKDLAVDGNDIIRELGIPPGPEVGLVLEALLESVLEDPALNRREMLLKIAGKYYENRIG